MAAITPRNRVLSPGSAAETLNPRKPLQTTPLASAPIALPHPAELERDALARLLSKALEELGRSYARQRDLAEQCESAHQRADDFRVAYDTLFNAHAADNNRRCAAMCCDEENNATVLIRLQCAHFVCTGYMAAQFAAKRTDVALSERSVPATVNCPLCRDRGPQEFSVFLPAIRFESPHPDFAQPTVDERPLRALRATIAHEPLLQDFPAGRSLAKRCLPDEFSVPVSSRRAVDPNASRPQQRGGGVNDRIVVESDDDDEDVNIHGEILREDEIDLILGPN